MNILFLTLVKIKDLSDRGIYADLLRKFYHEGNKIYIVCPTERREGQKTSIKTYPFGKVLNVRTLNIQKTNVIEKGLATLSIEQMFLRSIKKHFSDIRFDLVIYSSPPITFSKIVSFIKQRDQAFCYLLLKDIFPQNAVDLKMLKQGGLLHRMFQKKEQQLYNLSDAIGCMSPANVRYLLHHNPHINKEKVEENPNTIEPVAYIPVDEEERKAIRMQYNLPVHKKIFVYGGNLGKPQGLSFLIETIQKTKDDRAFFLIIGSGTEYKALQKWFEENQPANAALMPALPQVAYHNLLKACDIGLLFLHKDFTIPNFPSRLLSYLEIKMPVIAATDPNTDVGKIIENAGCGYWVISGDQQKMQQQVQAILNMNTGELDAMKKNAWELLNTEYHVSRSYELIKNRITDV